VDLIKVFAHINNAVKLIEQELNEPIAEEKRWFLQGAKKGFSGALDVINTINAGAVEVNAILRKCEGYGDQKGVCDGRVRKEFLVLYCPSCQSERLSKSTRPIWHKARPIVDPDECIILLLKEHTNGQNI
jgi:hypothetical protein